MTPEGELKKKIKDFLNQRWCMWTFWPVQTGMGRRTNDCIGVYYGVPFMIEVKAPKKKPTALQMRELVKFRDAGGVAFWCDHWEQFMSGWLVIKARAEQP